MAISIIFIILLFLTIPISKIIYRNGKKYLNIFFISLIGIYLPIILLYMSDVNSNVIKWCFWAIFIVLSIYWIIRMYRSINNNYRYCFSLVIKHYIDKKYLYLGLIFIIIIFCFSNPVGTDVNYQIKIGNDFSSGVNFKEYLLDKNYSYILSTNFWLMGSIFPTYELSYAYTILMPWVFCFIIFCILAQIFALNNVRKIYYIFIGLVICWIPFMPPLGIPNSFLVGGISILFILYELITKKSRNYLMYSIIFFSPTAIPLLVIGTITINIINIFNKQKIFLIRESSIFLILLLSLIIVGLKLNFITIMSLLVIMISIILAAFVVEYIYPNFTISINLNRTMIIILGCLAIITFIILAIIFRHQLTYQIKQMFIVNKNAGVISFLCILIPFICYWIYKRKIVLVQQFFLINFLLIILCLGLPNSVLYDYVPRRMAYSIAVTLWIISPYYVVLILRKIKEKFTTWNKELFFCIGTFGSLVIPIIYFTVSSTAIPYLKITDFFQYNPNHKYVKTEWVKYFENNLKTTKYYSDFPIQFYTHNLYIKNGKYIAKNSYNYYLPSISALKINYPNVYEILGKNRITTFTDLNNTQINNLQYILLDNINPNIGKLRSNFNIVYVDSIATIFIHK